MNSLQQLLTRCYQLNRDGGAVPPKLLVGLEKHELILSDYHIQHHEIGPLCRFLTSKTTLNSLEVLILNKSHAKTKRLRRLAATKAGLHSGLHMHGAQLLKAVCAFLERSEAMRTLEIDGISLSVAMLQCIGSAISERQNISTLGFQQVIFRNMSLGGEGLRALSPHFGKCLIQCLTLENCNLGDDSLPYLSSIIKAHEAIQDKCFWNSTLRVYPEKNNEGKRQRQQQQVYSDGITNTGLLLLNLSRNKYTSIGSKGICKLITSNQWILGVNLGNNCIGEEGINRILECSSEASGHSALLCLHLRGNPGCTPESLNDMSERALQSMVNPLIATLPAHCASTLIKWLRLQEDNSPQVESTKATRKNKKQSYEANGYSHQNQTPVINAQFGAQEVISISSEPSRTQNSNVLDDGIEYNQTKMNDVDVVCDEELPSGQNYMHDSSAEGFFVPPSPGKGIDGRPPSRNSIRPRYDDVPKNNELPFSHTSNKRRQNSGAKSSTRSRRSNDDKLRRPMTSHSSRSNVNRGAERYTNPYDSVNLSSSRSRDNFVSSHTRRNQRSSLDILSTSKSTSSAIKKPPFRPSSANARIKSYLMNTQAHDSYLRSTEKGSPSTHNYLRRSTSAQSYVRGRSTSHNDTKRRRRQSSIELTRSRQQRIKHNSNSRFGDDRAQRSAELLVEKMGKGVMEELSKVVNSVSTELQNMSLQMQSLTESMSESVSLINMSRDVTFSTYHDAHKDNHVEEDMHHNIDDVKMMDMPGNHVDLSALNPNQLELIRLQHAMDEDVNLSHLIEDGLREKLSSIIQNVMHVEA